MSYHEFNDEDELRKFIETELASNINKRKHAKNNQAAKTTESVVSEHLDSFILIGYDFNGEPVNIINASTNQRKDALHTLLVKFITFNVT